MPLVSKSLACYLRGSHQRGPAILVHRARICIARKQLLKGHQAIAVRIRSSTGRWPPLEASISAILPNLSVALGSAPRSISRSTAGRWPPLEVAAPHPIYARSQGTPRLTTISLERSGAGGLCRRTAAFGSTISLTLNIAGARAERPGRVKLTSLLSPRRALSEQRAELLVRPPRVSATPDPKSLIRAQDSMEGKLCFPVRFFFH